MVHAIRFHEAGGPDVMKWEEVQVGDPGPGEIRVKQTAFGVPYAADSEKLAQSLGSKYLLPAPLFFLKST